MINEWFERGVQDAQNDQLNTTYYQHYYYYRLGYDQARREMRRPALTKSVTSRSFGRWAVIGGVALAAAGGAYYWPYENAGSAASQTAGPVVTLSRSPTVQATAKEATLEPLALRPEGFATIINTEEAPLRARERPSLGSPIQAQFRQGSQVQILEGPVASEGYIWWLIEGEGGSGWSVEGEPGGTSFLSPISEAEAIAAAATPTVPPPPPTNIPATPSPSPVVPTATSIPTLRAGGFALIVNLGDSPLRARSNPGLDNAVQTSFSAGSSVAIVEGPVEADGYTWWLLEGDEGRGWSVEGIDGTVFLEPQAPPPTTTPAPTEPPTATSTPAPTATSVPTETPAPTATPAPTFDPSIPALRPGGNATVQSPLRARTKPAINSSVQMVFDTGSEVTIIEGPVEADGYTWWLIEGDEGRGWSVEGDDGVVFLEPKIAATATATRPAATAARPAATTARPAATNPPAPTATRTPASTPTRRTVALRKGGFATVVNLGGSSLRARLQPGLNSTVRAQIKDGSRVYLADGPYETDGYTWWLIEGDDGRGWSVQGEPGGVQYLEGTE